MKVSFTTKEYSRLLELVYMGLWMSGSRPEEGYALPERYEAIAQKVYGLAQTFGCADYVEADIGDTFFPSEKLETGPAMEAIEQDAEDTFWSELALRLAGRDLQAELGPTKHTTERDSEQEARLTELEEAYWREFEASGVAHLVVLKGGKG